MILISNLTLNIKDGSTIASTSIYGEDKKTYINIGSGNVFKLDWETPDDTIDSYSLVIKRYDPTLNVHYDILNKNIGLVNEFFVDSPMLPIAPDQYILSIYLVAYGKYGTVVTSDVINPYISKGSGSYVKVNSDDYAEPIMKRALAFVYTPDTLATAEGNTLVDNEGNTIHVLAEDLLKTEDTLVDSTGRTLMASVEGEEDTVKTLYADTTKLLYSPDWTVVQEGYTKATNTNTNETTWRTNDITYEVLQVLNETTGKYEVLTDHENDPIYIL